MDGLLRRTLLVLVLVLLLASCGGGGAGGGGSVSPTILPTVPSEPVTEFGYSANTEGIPGARLAGFLTHHDATDSPYSIEGLERWGSTPPVVRVVLGARPAYVRDVQRAVEIINSALPRDFQMTFDPTFREAKEKKFGHANGEYFDGEITVLFADSGPGGPGGWAQSSYGREPERYGPATDLVKAARVSVDSDETGAHRLALIIHEIGHVLGIGGDTWADIYSIYPNSIMTYAPGQPLQPNGSAVLYPLDRDSFLALYSVLEPGMSPDEVTAALAGWTATAYRVQDGFDFGDGHTLSFGAWSRGVWAESWTDYTPSGTPLASNTTLTGSATWNGRMAGLEPDGDAVRGNVALTVVLDTLDGDVAFTDLRTWTAGVNPATATGVAWGSGSLSYDIEVTGASFANNTGEVKGGFVGPNHEGMAGTLERDDLSAGFGGVR